MGPLSYTFNEYSFREANGKRTPGINVPAELEAEEVILRNTFINAQTTQQFPVRMDGSTQRDPGYHPQIRWTDSASRNKIPLAKEGPSVGMTVIPRDQRVTKHHHVLPNNLKSSLKPPLSSKQLMTGTPNNKDNVSNRNSLTKMDQSKKPPGSQKMRESSKAKVLNFYD